MSASVVFMPVLARTAPGVLERSPRRTSSRNSLDLGRAQSEEPHQVRMSTKAPVSHAYAVFSR